MPNSLPSQSEALRAEAQIRACLEPADQTFVRQRLMLLKLTTVQASTEGMSEAAATAMLGAQIGEYLRLLAGFPADIWADACDTWARRSKWFPRVAELEELMRPKLELRQRQHQRARQILDAVTNPRAAIQHQPRSAEQRNAELRALKAQHGLDPDRPLVEQLFKRADAA